MIDFEHPTHHRRATKVIDREIRRALVFVFEEAEAFGFAGFAVADQVYVCGFAVLGEDRQDVAFGQVEGEAAYVNECSVLGVS